MTSGMPSAASVTPAMTSGPRRVRSNGRMPCRMGMRCSAPCSARALTTDPPIGPTIRLAPRSRVRGRAREYCSAMAYDEDLADRIRELVAGEKGVTEKKMFGGLAFLVGGNMAISASGQGGILVRVDPVESDALVARSNAYVAVMRGHEMPGWLRVDAEHVRTKRDLARWVDRGVAFARSLPPK